MEAIAHQPMKLLALLIGFMGVSLNTHAETWECYSDNDNSHKEKYLASSFQWENDIMFSDRWYTNGMKYSRVGLPNCSKDGAKSLDEVIGNSLAEMAGENTSTTKPVLLVIPEIGMNMYTPKVISIAGPQPNDRPWTGWLYYGQAWELNEIKGTPVDNGRTHYGVDSKKIFEVQVGALGSWAHQDQVQKAWHRLIGAQQPMGWANQSAGRPGLNLAYTYQKNYNDTDDKATGFNSNIRAGVMAGNVMSQVSAGTGFTLSLEKFKIDGGNFLPIAALQSDAKQVRPAITLLSMNTDNSSSNKPNPESESASQQWTRHNAVYAFGDIEGRYIFNSHFIEGTNVKLTHLVFDARAGLAWKIPGTDATIRFTRLIRTSEFNYPAGNSAPSQRITQLSVECNWGEVRNPYSAK